MSEHPPRDQRSKMWLPTLPERDGARTVTGQWARGTSGNPAGRPRGARNKLSEEIITAFSADFVEHGAEVIARVRVEHPEQYLAIVARLVPREFQVREENRAPEQLTEEELEELIAVVRSIREDRS
jgi:Family of unknown function (DUF5681)